MFIVCITWSCALIFARCIRISFSSPHKDIYGWSYLSCRALVKSEHIRTIFTPLLVWVRRRKKTLLLRNSVWSSVAQFLCLNKQCGYTPQQPQEPGGSGLNWKCCGTVIWRTMCWTREACSIPSVVQWWKRNIHGMTSLLEPLLSSFPEQNIKTSALRM